MLACCAVMHAYRPYCACDRVKPALMQALQQQQPSREAALREAAEEKAAAIQKRAQAELDIKELRERLRTDSTTRVRYAHAANALAASISRTCIRPYLRRLHT